jgi:hypothetical protein
MYIKCTFLEVFMRILPFFSAYFTVYCSVKRFQTMVFNEFTEHVSWGGGSKKRVRVTGKYSGPRVDGRGVFKWKAISKNGRKSVGLWYLTGDLRFKPRRLFAVRRRKSREHGDYTFYICTHAQTVYFILYKCGDIKRERERGRTCSLTRRLNVPANSLRFPNRVRESPPNPFNHPLAVFAIRCNGARARCWPLWNSLAHVLSRRNIRFLSLFFPENTVCRRFHFVRRFRCTRLTHDGGKKVFISRGRLWCCPSKE